MIGGHARLAYAAALSLLLVTILCSNAGCREAESRTVQHARDRIASTAGTEAVAATTASIPAGGAQQLCAAIHRLPAESKQACCDTTDTAADYLYDNCVTAVGAALSRGTVELRAADVEACARSAAAELHGCDWVTPLNPAPSASCRSVIRGLLGRGDACLSSVECATGLHCMGSSSNRVGVCAPPMPERTQCGSAVDSLAAHAGQLNYERDHPECDAGFCQAHRCKKYMSIGDSCSHSQQCGPDNHCAGGVCSEGSAALTDACTDAAACGADATCLDGVCSPLKQAGESCTSPYECVGNCLRSSGAREGVCGMQCTHSF